MKRSLFFCFVSRSIMHAIRELTELRSITRRSWEKWRLQKQLRSSFCRVLEKLALSLRLGNQALRVSIDNSLSHSPERREGKTRVRESFICNSTGWLWYVKAKGKERQSVFFEDRSSSDVAAELSTLVPSACAFNPSSIKSEIRTIFVGLNRASYYCDQQKH